MDQYQFALQSIWSFFMKYLMGLFIVAAIVSGCGTTQEKEVERERDFSEKGTVTKEVITVNRKIRSELHRILDGTVVEGKGTFKNNNKEVARNGALTLAINDMAKKVGEVLIEEDTTITNDEITSIVRTRASNLVAGYTIMVDTYDEETRVAEVIVRQDGERIASEIARIVTDE